MTGKTVATTQRRTGANHVLVVATNPEYEKLCARSLRRLPASANVRLFHPSPKKTIKDSKPRTESTLFVSRLSDMTEKGAALASTGSAAKQLVFLEEFPVEAVAARLLPLNIRNPERIHLTASRDPGETEELIYRLLGGLADDKGNPSIVDAWIEGEQLTLLSPSFMRLRIPLEKLTRFLGANKTDVARFEIDEDGRFLHWPHTDTHLGWTQFEQIVDPTLAIAAAPKNSRYNRQYGAAIRTLRESRGLKQSDIQGITARQLRRVEHGEQAVSKTTLEILAKAHHLPLVEYIDLLAKLVSNMK